MAGQQFGIPPKNIVNLDYTGADLALTPVTEANRDPTVNDKNYPIDCLWRNTVSRALWYLSGFNSTGALWLPFSTGASGPLLMVLVPAGASPITPDTLGNMTFTSTGGTVVITGVTGPGAGDHTINFDITGGGTAVEHLTGDSGGPLNPTANNFNILGSTVANATNAKPVFVAGAGSTETIQVQVATTSTVGAKNINNAGLASFDSAVFTVDAATGFISSIGGLAAIEKLNGDDGNDIVPTSGLIHLFGNTVVFGTHVKPVFFERKSATTDTVELDVQLATTSTFAGRTINDAGLASFDSAAFQIDAATGFVQLLGGANPAVQGLIPDAHTGPGTTPVVANSSGNITITGAQVATGTIGANVIRTDSLAANTMTIEIQRSTAVAAPDSTKNGVSHFDSGSFSVDSTGFVTFTGTPPVLQWINQTADLNPLVKTKAYQANKAGTACALTLPTGATFGDTIRVQGFGATGWVLNAGTGQTIRVEEKTTTVAGSVTNTGINDYIEVVCSSTTTTWFAIAHGGNLTVA